MKSALRLFLVFCLGTVNAAAPLAAQDIAPKEALEPAAPLTTEPAPMPPTAGKPMPPDVSMEAFGTANPNCLEWSDTCRICARDAQNNIGCSTTGIACLPGEISCQNVRK